MRKLLVLLLLPFLCYAEDSSISKFLKDEPATLLDIGMVRLDNLTREFERRVGVFWTTPSGTREAFRTDINTVYHAKDDKIYVSFFAMNSTAGDAQMKEGCEMAMDQITIWILKSLPGLFMHEGFNNTMQSATEPHKSIADLFELSCYISASHDSSIGRFWARRTLRDPELKIGPWPMKADDEPPSSSQPRASLVEDCYARNKGQAVLVPCPTSPSP